MRHPAVADNYDGPSWRHVAMLTGRANIFALSHRWIVHLVVSGVPVCVIDCAIRFNVYAIAEEAMRRDVAPDGVLREIGVRRAFTPYQILETIRDLDVHGSRARPVFLLAPMKQFFDPDVAKEEARFLLEKMVERLYRLRNRNVPLLIVEKPGYDHPAFLSVFEKMKRLAQPLWVSQPHCSLSDSFALAVR